MRMHKCQFQLEFIKKFMLRLSRRPTHALSYIHIPFFFSSSLLLGELACMALFLLAFLVIVGLFR